jgi:predicted metal-dependent RNase
LFPLKRRLIRDHPRILNIAREAVDLVANIIEDRAVAEKQFLQETNFSEDVEETKPEKWDAEASNKAIRQHNERIWTDANLRDGSY